MTLHWRSHPGTHYHACMNLPRQLYEIMHLNLDLLKIPAKHDFKSQQRQKYRRRLLISRTSLQVCACMCACKFVCVRPRYAKRHSSPKVARVAAGGEYFTSAMLTSTVRTRLQVCQNSGPETHSGYCTFNTRTHTHRQTDTRLLNSQRKFSVLTY